MAGVFKSKNLHLLRTFGTFWDSSSIFYFTESPNNLLIQRVGDATQDITAAAGEDLELECIATGGNPPAKLAWFTNGQEINSGHVQEDKRLQGDNGIRTWTSFSRLTLPVSKDDNGATISCVAKHPALEEPMTAQESLTIHCKSKKILF
jgi:hypothetical protein